MNLGATYLGEGRCSFCVWAPSAEAVIVHVVSPKQQLVPLKKGSRGYHQAVLSDVSPGALYYYQLDDKKERPDPASRFQPDGVHGPSQVVDSHFIWDDQCWCGLPLRDYIIYEVHVGTFTTEGTLDAAIDRLDDLKGLGITAVEVMPVAQFPGTRNWGYDGVYPFAVQNSYGGPESLRRLVNACHQRGLAVVLDVVYNHLGPEGNYLADFGYYFTDRYRTPWGAAINFDGPGSDEVRRFFLENALWWVTEFHIDALRIDAVHGIFDFSAQPFLGEMALVVHEQAERLGRRIYVIAESDLNDSRLVRVPEMGGYGLDAQWNDDFHHALHTLLTHERTGYYKDFGQFYHFVKAFCEGFVYSGEYSMYRKRRHGNSSRSVPPYRFVVFAQNHDQVGNRMRGDRLACLVSIEKLKLAAGTVLLSPFIPLLFMGEEYGETAPFSYFVSHSDPALVEATRKGRLAEFDEFEWSREPPDPQAEATFQAAKLNQDRRFDGDRAALYGYHRECIRLRKEIERLARSGNERIEVIGYEKQEVLVLTRQNSGPGVAVLLHVGEASVSITLPLPAGQWIRRLDSAREEWNGPGSAVPAEFISDGETSLTLAPYSAVVFMQREEG